MKPDRPPADAPAREALRTMFDAALGAASVEGKLEPFLPEPPQGRTVVVGAGKAAAAMARELDRLWPGDLAGAVVAPHGGAMPEYHGRIEVLEAGHPVPDQCSVAAGKRMCDLVSGLGPGDLVIALISGGGSALLVGLPEGVTLADKQAVTRALLASGAPIGEINTVRRQLSTIKGGGLARLAGAAPVLTLAVSDIPGDAIAAIGSGPTIAGPDRSADARTILSRHGIVPSAMIERHLARIGQFCGAQEQKARVRDVAHLVVRPADALAAAARAASAAGFEAIVLGDDLEGEARELGAEHARQALRLLREGRRACLISGGETTVTVRGHGRGGRNGEYLLGALVALDGQSGVSALAADTDGIDGSERNAGAMCFPSSLARARALGLDAADFLSRNDSYSFLSALEDLVVTGPTFTNVNDFRLIMIDDSKK